MKKLCTLLLAAAMLLGAASGASAIEFKAKGTWLMGFEVGEIAPIHKYRAPGEAASSRTNTNDKFNAQQRVRLFLDAVASENLSGTVGFEIGTNVWGNAAGGAALGADSTSQIKLKRAYLDWLVPNTDLSVRMGIQGIALPNVAGGSAIMDADAAGVVASYKVNENAALTAMWVRPLNDNFAGTKNNGNKAPSAYLDNLDLFGLMAELKFDGFSVTPWAMYGMKGAYAMDGIADFEGKDGAYGTKDGNLPFSLYPYPGLSGLDRDADPLEGLGGTSKGYGSIFFAGLPFTITAFDPLNIEVDLNYGYVEPMGRFNATKLDAAGNEIVKRSSTLRQGWLAKALVEYKLDFGVPGIFGWYGSGDDGNPRNGSERMPSIAPCGNFTSFMGDGNWGWTWQDFSMDYSGTWGIGAQIRDMSFVDKLSHTLRVAYWGGTNSPSMAKYMQTSYSWSDGWESGTGPYLTTNDGLLEFNLVNSYQIYENLELNLEASYIANFMDNSTWNKAGQRDSSFQKQDVWKVEAIFAYTF